ncbi:MAG: fumarylacetoacetase [Actinomycetota bacterium]
MSDLRSWVPVPEDSDFPIQNLPYGVFRRDGEPRIAVAIGEHVLDLRAVAHLFPGGVAPVLRRETLNDLLALGAPVWRGVRERITALLAVDAPAEDRPAAEAALVPMTEAEMLLPVRIGDYVDFYSSEHHATNLGRMFRPDGEPLMENWRHLPVGYHGRSGTVVVDGTPVVRPRGQRKPPGAAAPEYGPSARLDFELELGFLTGPENLLGEPIPVQSAADAVFGLVLVNDWSARDVQAWEYQPLGPFLGKSFATTISPWVVPLDATIPHRVQPLRQDPAPLPHLRTQNDWVLDLTLEATLTPAHGEPTLITRTNASELYWTIAQQLAHATSNGAIARPGDLFASGTISGPEPGSYGSMIESSWNGTRPVTLVGGQTRSFLEDGDTVDIRGWLGGDGLPRIGFGTCRGTIVTARD